MLTDNAEPVRTYIQAKQEVATDISELRQFYRCCGDFDRTERCHHLQSKLAEDRFHLGSCRAV